MAILEWRAVAAVGGLIHKKTGRGVITLLPEVLLRETSEMLIVDLRLCRKKESITQTSHMKFKSSVYPDVSDGINLEPGLFLAL